MANFLKGLCAYPGVDCYDLLSALTGTNICRVFMIIIFSIAMRELFSY